MRQETQGKEIHEAQTRSCPAGIGTNMREGGAKEEVTVGGDGYKYNKAVYLWFDYDNCLEPKQGHCPSLLFWHVLTWVLQACCFLRVNGVILWLPFSRCCFRNLCWDTYTDIQWVDVIFYTGRPVLRLTYSCYVCKIKLNVTTWVHLLMQFMWPREADLLTLW